MLNKYLLAKMRLEASIKKLALIKELNDKAEYEQRIKIGKAQQELMGVCPHENTKKEDDSNYHKNENWTIIRCKDCDKQLDRY